jgi:hypothetical protein
MTDDITTEERLACFKLLDEHARTKHHCFVAEFFLQEQSETYFVCFRPVESTTNRFACKYLQFGIEEIRTMASSQSLPLSTTNQLDEALTALGMK